MAKPKLFYLSIIFLSFLSGIAVLVDARSVAILASIAVAIALMIKREWALYAIIITLFLEARAFSFYFFDARIRSIQLIELFALVGLVIHFLMRNLKPYRTPLDMLLVLYILINVISLNNAPLFSRGLKVTILLVSLVLLYSIVTNLLLRKNIFEKAFRLLLYVGLLEIIYGLYQVYAGFCNWYLGAKLPVGPIGVTHVDFLGVPWGRPYGTLFEPDWYGAVAMFYALLFISLYFSNARGKKHLYLFGLVVSVAGLFLSFVRAAWLGFIVGVVFLSIYSPKVKGSRFRMHYSISIMLIAILSIWLFSSLSPVVNAVIKRRFTTIGDAGISSENVRFVQIAHSIKSFFNHPIIGNGPGSFAVHGTWGQSDDSLGAESKLLILRRYNPSILSTALEDTGIAGFIMLIIILLRFAAFNMKKIPVIDSPYQSIGLGLFSGLIGLFASYVFTHGFWIPFTWVFLAFNMAALILGTNEKNG